jgi:uncharacterized protein (TIGR03435 family)
LQSPRIAILAAAWCGLAAQTNADLPAFESASVKPSTATTDGSSWHSRAAYLEMKNQSLRNLIKIAYGVRDDAVTGGPKWIDSDHFDVEARAPSAADDPQMLLMLRQLLRERFAVTVHRENRNVDGYTLALIKGGLKIRPDTSEGRERSNSHRGQLAAERLSMGRLAESLARILGAPVVDTTGVKDRYSFTLEWNAEPPRAAPGDSALPSDPAGPTIFDAVARLGLKLENRKLPAELVVIDKAEKPTAN